MNFSIENEFLSAEINEFGAELSSFKSKQSGIEYLWQGNPVVWTGRSPILFPIIGQLLNGKFIFEGNEYFLPKHGFARESAFEAICHEQSRAVFILKSSDITLQQYPFSFELSVEFVIKGKMISVIHHVRNIDNKRIYFSIGAHPGFNFELGDYLEFESEETLMTERIDQNAIIVDEKFPLLDNSKNIDITADIFTNDALFLTGYKSTYVKLKSPRHKRELLFNFNSAPYLGIWAKPGAPYVCIEPWYGINDSYHLAKDISEKRGIQSLGPNESFSFSWSAEISEPGND